MTLEHSEQRVCLVAMRDAHPLLFNMINRGALTADAHHIGVSEILFRQGANRLWHRRREDRGLAIVWSGIENALYVLEKAQLEHLVALIEHHELQMRQV